MILDEKLMENCNICKKQFPIEQTVCCQEELEFFEPDGVTTHYVSGDSRTRCMDCYKDWVHQQTDDISEELGKTMSGPPSPFGWHYREEREKLDLLADRLPPPCPVCGNTSCAGLSGSFCAD